MRRAGLCVGLLVVAACAEAPSEPSESEWSLQADRRIAKGSYVRLASDVLISQDCTPTYTTDTRGCDDDEIVIGQTKYIGLRTPNSALFQEAFSALRSPGQLSFVVGGTDTIPAPPSPGPFRSAFVRGEASLMNLLAAGGVLPTDTIPGPPSPFLLANASTALMVLSVDQLAKKRVLAYSETAVELEVFWTINTVFGPHTYIMQATLPPTDTIPSRGTDCEANPDGC